MARVVTITGFGLTRAEIVAVARGAARVRLGEEVAARIESARRVVAASLARGEAVYGLTTGLGANLGHRLAASEIADFQERILRGRAAALGPCYPAETVRAALLVRANGLARGGAGASAACLTGVIGLLNSGISPLVPSLGSIGAADLTPMAHLMLPLIGEGEVEMAGATMPAAEALRRAGLEKTVLAPKDGLALVNSNGLSVGHAVLLLEDAAELAELAALAAALSCEGYRANPSPFLAEVAAARPAPGQEEAAAALRRWLAGSALWQPGAARAVQDALSFRCIAPVHGAALAARDLAARAVEAELNAAADNPLVLLEAGRIVSTGNFHTAALALAFDTLALALVPVADLAAGRMMKLMQPEASGLPKFLTPVGGDRAGFAPVQKTIAALCAECRLRANPASLDFTAVANGVEDHAPQTPLVLRKAEELLAALRRLLAIELMLAAQAVDLRTPPPVLGPPLAAAQAAIRALVPRLDEDRSLGPEIERLATGSAAVVAAARQAVLGSGNG
ncbi:MAG TPA: aromatic amino acid ammonia-lyase [Stellaceae bacterium]|nr:aromatic amino acid ammonia-lyase [Stellaceae bacterium]